VNALAGTPALVRLALRRDRIRIPVWVAAVVALVLVTAQTVQGLYPTAGALAAAAAVIEDNPTAVVMNGPAQGLGTLGGRVRRRRAAVPSWCVRPPSAGRGRSPPPCWSPPGPMPWWPWRSRSG
jgi:ABC-2 type transport system permease protein